MDGRANECIRFRREAKKQQIWIKLRKKGIMKKARQHPASDPLDPKLQKNGIHPLCGRLPNRY